MSDFFGDLMAVTKILRVVAASLILIVPRCLYAQEVPRGEEPAAQAERFKETSGRDKERPWTKKKEISPIEVSKEKAAPLPSAGTFVLKEVAIAGATALRPAELQRAYEPYLNKEISIKELETIALAVETAYERKGYLTTGAYIPEQDIKDGKVEIKVSEGRMGALKIEGGRWFSPSLIEKYYHAKKSHILNVDVLQRDILRLNQNPDLEVKAVLSPGEISGTSDVTLQLQDKFPWHAGVGEDNQGTRLTGKYRTSYILRSTNLTGLADTLFVDALMSRDSFGESVSYSVPIGTYGTRVSVDASYFTMTLGEEFRDFDITGQAQIYSPRVTFEVALQESFQVFANAGIDIKSIIRKMSGSTTSDDQLRLPWCGLDLKIVDAFGGRTEFSPKLVFGRDDIFGACRKGDPLASRAGTGGSFVAYTQNLNRIQKMPFRSYLSIRSRCQLASHSLPSSEQLQIGGAYSVRGYPEGDYLADEGGFISTDWIFPLYVIPEDWRLKGQTVALRYQVQPVIFADFGGGRIQKVMPGERRSRFLMGAGGGVRLNFSLFSLRAEWAAAMGGDKPTMGAGPSSFYLTFQSEI